MPISGLTTNYTGRQVDLLIFSGYNANNLGNQPVQLVFGKPSQYCAGIQKLVQRYAISLMTALGSQPGFPTFGTSFMPQVNSLTQQVSAVSVQHIFNFANASVIATFKNFQSTVPATTPLDEQISTATLLSYSIVEGFANFSIALVTLSGSTIQFVVPLPIN